MQPRSPPIPIFATWQASIATAVIEFNKPLQVASVLKLNWVVRDPPNIHFDVGGTGTATGRFVTLQLLSVAPQFGPAKVRYTAGVPDVVGVNGLPVAAFDDFPITMI